MNTIKNNAIIALAIAFLINPLYAVAGSLNADYKGGLAVAQYNDKGGTRTVISIIRQVISFFLTFLAALAVLVILIAGIMYITSGGDEGKVETAKKWIIYAIIGLIIALLGWVIVNIVSNVVIGP